MKTKSVVSILCVMIVLCMMITGCAAKWDDIKKKDVVVTINNLEYTKTNELLFWMNFVPPFLALGFVWFLTDRLFYSAAGVSTKVEDHWAMLSTCLSAVSPGQTNWTSQKLSAVSLMVT